MTNDILLGKLEEHLSYFKKMYDVVRLVDPVKKRVVECRGVHTRETGDICYDYWDRGHICDNCISMRAYLGDKCFIKLEQSGDRIMVVTALPVENTENPAIIELLKNATDGMLFGSGEYSQGRSIQNIIAEINGLAVKDDLTGIYNRRHVSERLPVDLVRSKLNEAPVSVIFMDVDNLKEINDLHGHLHGDQALAKVAKVISENIRTDIDWAARYGGDEFFICLNGTGAEDAYRIAERIRLKINDLEIPPEGGGIRVTASLGVCTVENCDLTAEEVIEMADQKMYEAKKRGKNMSLFAKGCD